MARSPLIVIPLRAEALEDVMSDASASVAHAVIGRREVRRSRGVSSAMRDRGPIVANLSRRGAYFELRRD